MVNRSFRFAIDRGGTFTDIWAKCPNGNIQICKLLSDDEAQYTDAPTEGIRRILEKEGAMDFSFGGVIDSNLIEWIRMGTTVATNALLEKHGERIALLITKGFGDLLAIGDQSRKHLFNLNIGEPCILYEEIVEVEERIILKIQDCHLTTLLPEIITKSGEKIIIWKSLNQEEVKSSLKKIFSKGIRSLAIVLLHSYLYDEHEKMIEKLAIEMGFKNVVLSSKSSRMIKIVPRGSNSYVKL